MPKLPDPLKMLTKLDNAIDAGSRIIDSFSNGIDRIDNALGKIDSTPSAIYIDETPSPVARGTACLPCSRDHLSTTSSALSEGVRFARDEGVKHPEVIKRLRIAVDELNIMERIDLAPSEIASLKGEKKALADWVLSQSRNLRHDITSIKTPDDMEAAAANAAATTEEFMSRFYDIPEEECSTCGEVSEKIKDFIEKRNRQSKAEGGL